MLYTWQKKTKSRVKEQAYYRIFRVSLDIFDILILSDFESSFGPTEFKSTLDRTHV